MCQINKSKHLPSASPLSLVIQEASIFLDQNYYLYCKQVLASCENLQQIFTFFIEVVCDYRANNYKDKINVRKDDLSLLIQQRSEKCNSIKSKGSIQSTSSQCTIKSNEQSTLIKQIQNQQQTIEKLKMKLYKTQKMILITKKLEREAYKNIDETIGMMVKKDEKIAELMKGQEYLKRQIRERDELLEQTVRIIQKR